MIEEETSLSCFVTLMLVALLSLPRVPVLYFNLSDSTLPTIFFMSYRFVLSLYAKSLLFIEVKAGVIRERALL
jgi:hypothetical protein